MNKLLEIFLRVMFRIA